MVAVAVGIDNAGRKEEVEGDGDDDDGMKLR